MAVPTQMIKTEYDFDTNDLVTVKREFEPVITSTSSLTVGTWIKLLAFTDLTTDIRSDDYIKGYQ